MPEDIVGDGAESPFEDDYKDDVEVVEGEELRPWPKKAYENKRSNKVHTIDWHYTSKPVPKAKAKGQTWSQPRLILVLTRLVL